MKLLLGVYPRPVVGHRVAQATALPSGGGAEAPFGVVAVADQVPWYQALVGTPQ